MKKNIIIIGSVYLIVAILTYAMTQRVKSLDNINERTNQNKEVVIKLK